MKIVIVFLFLIVQNLETPHRVLRFECSECHNSNSWQEVKFNHQKTGFALEDRHNGVKCAGCHSLEDFKLSGGDCVSCHDDIHQGKLSRSCDRCHTVRGWSVFNALAAHANTSFPLLGAHACLDCRACHTSETEGEFSFLQSECVSCHRADFERASNPSHTQMGFQQRCEDCHMLVGWNPANFSQHDPYFPIFSGTHAGLWGNCSACHLDPQNYRVFSCFECHEHSQSRMDGTHREVAGYSYNSDACYTCHPSGSGGN